MNTPAVNNPASISSSPAPGKSSNASNSDVAFDQVLSREVADRKSASDSNSAGPKDAGQAAQPSQPNAKPATAKKSDEKSDDGAPTETTDAAQADSSAQAQTAAAQLLALVADLGSLKPAPAVTDTASPKADATSIAAAGKGDALLAGVRDTATATGEGKDAALKPQTTPTDFAAALKLGADARQAQDTTTSNGTDARLDPRAISTTATTATGAAALATDLKAQDGQAALPAIDLGALKVKEIPSTIAAGMAPLQQAAFNAQALAAHPTDKLTPQVGTPGWDQALGQKVVWMVAGAQQSATLSLNPPDLGPLQIVLNVSNSQATATFTAAQPEVRQALEAALPRLREMLGDAGIQLGQATVGSGSPNSNWGSGGEQSQHGTARAGESAGDALAMPLRTSRIQAISGGLGLVDTFA